MRVAARGIRPSLAPAGYGRRHGPPRLYDERRVATAIHLPITLREELQTAAATRNVSVNLLVNRAIRDYPERLAPADDEER
ncbi:MAG: hypothetical protein M3Y04_03250 [Actinomycetota bacterium]|nr:hypothetical protein [Actinomycetota bacterium]